MGVVFEFEVDVVPRQGRIAPHGKIGDGMGVRSVLYDRQAGEQDGVEEHACHLRDAAPDTRRQFAVGDHVRGEIAVLVCAFSQGLIQREDLVGLYDLDGSSPLYDARVVRRNREGRNQRTQCGAHLMRIDSKSQGHLLLPLFRSRDHALYIDFDPELPPLVGLAFHPVRQHDALIEFFVQHA